MSDDNKKLSDADLANMIVEEAHQDVEDSMVAEEGAELVTPALDSDAGQEALQAEVANSDDAQISDASATGDYNETPNPDSNENPSGTNTSDEVGENAGVVDDVAAEAETVTESELPTSDEPAEELEATDEVGAEETLGDSANDNPNAKWYVVHTYSGHENKVAATLKQKVASEHLEAQILDVLVPTQDKIEIRSGKKEAIKEKIFPGYILVKMVLEDISWLAVRTTPGVTSFVGMSNKPTPIPEAEVKTIVKFMTQGAAPTFKDVFFVDDTVKIVEGPFAQFIGKVDNVDKDRGKVKVLVSIFGRETPVELDFLQVQKL